MSHAIPSLSLLERARRSLEYRFSTIARLQMTVFSYLVQNSPGIVLTTELYSQMGPFIFTQQIVIIVESLFIISQVADSILMMSAIKINVFVDIQVVHCVHQVKVAQQRRQVSEILALDVIVLKFLDMVTTL